MESALQHYETELFLTIIASEAHAYNSLNTPTSLQHLQGQNKQDISNQWSAINSLENFWRDCFKKQQSGSHWGP